MSSGSPAESVCGCGHGQNDHNHNGTGVCYFGETEHECYCMKFWHAEVSTSGSPASDEICSCRNIMGLHRYGRRCENYVERSPATSEKYLCGCGYGSDDEAVMFDHVESQHAGSAWVGEQR